jgi:hypothetical protein
MPIVHCQLKLCNYNVMSLSDYKILESDQPKMSDGDDADAKESYGDDAKESYGDDADVKECYGDDAEFELLRRRQAPDESAIGGDQVHVESEPIKFQPPCPHPQITKGKRKADSGPHEEDVPAKKPPGRWGMCSIQ